jgi:hypothetical protein
MRFAATPGTPGADMSAVSRCCMPLHADVAWYDSTKYTLHSSTDCSAAYRVCNLPSRVQAVWVCGCPGGDCSGRSVASARNRWFILHFDGLFDIKTLQERSKPFALCSGPAECVGQQQQQAHGSSIATTVKHRQQAKGISLQRVSVNSTWSWRFHSSRLSAWGMQAGLVTVPCFTAVCDTCVACDPSCQLCSISGDHMLSRVLLTFVLS